MVLRYLLLFLGVFACSTSAVLIRMSGTDPFVLTAMRLLTGTAILVPLYLAQTRRSGRLTRAQLGRTRLPSVVLALHLITWTLGARMTVVAQASLIVNLVPIAMPFFLIWLAAERINRAEITGTVLAIAGVAILSVKDAWLGGGSLAGDALCFLSMILFALYLSLGRRNRDFPSIWLYVVPVYGQAGLICLAVALPRISGFAWGSGREWALMVALGVIPTVCGHSLLNAAMRRIRGQMVSLCNSTQFVFAGVLGFALFGEVPDGFFYPACAIVLAGLVIVVLASPAPLPEPP
jgi:drug/metabolite transporter (DMT)-like permease